MLILIGRSYCKHSIILWLMTRLQKVIISLKKKLRHLVEELILQDFFTLESFSSKSVNLVNILFLYSRSILIFVPLRHSYKVVAYLVFILKSTSPAPKGHTKTMIFLVYVLPKRALRLWSFKALIIWLVFNYMKVLVCF